MAKKIIESQIVDTTVLVDSSSGEVLNEETHTETSYKTFHSAEDSFFKTYTDHLEYLDDLPKTHRRLIDCLATMMFYADDVEHGEQYVELKPLTKKSIGEKCGLIEIHSINVALSQLVKKNIIRRVDVGTYQINPYLFGKGEWVYIEKLRETWDDYLNKKT